jgi:hypothetical protein
MHKVRTLGVIGLAAGLVATAVAVSGGKSRAGTGTQVPPTTPTAPATSDDKIQVALLLDTSGSMDGLIDQAKSQLWKISNNLATARRDGKQPRVEIALYEYGKATLPESTHWIRQILPFTTDLDKVSEQLFALTTNGGEEYCGEVIQQATRELEWSSRPNDLKMIFIAGNEPFTQGPVDYHSAIAGASAKGIVVNTIHCGAGDEPGWREAAQLARGEFVNIDHNVAVVHIDAPQDAELARLSAQINGTYVAYGAMGAEGQARQWAQDKNAAEAKQGASVERAVSKGSAIYSNSRWDLVDAAHDGTVDVTKLAANELPAEMQKMSVEERQAFVSKKAEERKAITVRIQELDDARRKFVADEMKKRGATATDTLDVAMLHVLTTEAAARGFELETK